MKIPRNPSRAWTILEAFASVKYPMTFEAASLIHGHMGEFPSNTRTEYKRHVDLKNLSHRDGAYSLSASVRKYFDDLVVPAKVVGDLVLPRVAPTSVPLPVNSVRIHCGRPGAMEYRDMPSLIGGKRVEYHAKSNGGALVEGDVK